MSEPPPTPAAYEYAGSHEHPVNRVLHAIGIPIIACGGIAAILGPRVVGVSRRMALTGVAGGWILPFVGHAIEGNRPAILGNPKAALDALRWWRRGAGRFARRMLPVALHPPNDVAQR